MITSDKSKADYSHRSEILTHGLRRDEWQVMAWTLERSGNVGLAQDINKFLDSKEVSK